MMAPPSGSSWPETMWRSVVWPAPFGPISAWHSPVRRSSDTSSVTRSAPKLFSRPRSARTGSAGTPASKDAGQPAAREEHDEDQEGAEDEAPVLGHVRQQFLQEDVGGGAQDRAV